MSLGSLKENALSVGLSRSRFGRSGLKSHRITRASTLPDRPWSSVSMDWISSLPKVGELRSGCGKQVIKVCYLHPFTNQLHGRGLDSLSSMWLSIWYTLPSSVMETHCRLVMLNDWTRWLTGRFWTEVFKQLLDLGGQSLTSPRVFYRPTKRKWENQADEFELILE